ncbi:MAG TPA: hypothetical protein VD793_05380, partial [Gemmatimonadales bacterium]|nr:hypothetical protein [Gemmatimonadales bacterium]
MTGGLWRRIKAAALTDVGMLLSGRTDEVRDAMERVLLEADFGPAAFPLIAELEGLLQRGTMRSDEQVRRWLAERIGTLLSDDGTAWAPRLNPAGPAVFLFLGVNGVGKTTQLAKLANRLTGE